jgi:hypothetical protein
MSERAEVKSISAIADFRTALLLYLGKIRPLLDDSLDEVSRTREWLRVDRRIFWENRVRHCARALSEAQQALFVAEVARLRAPSSAEVLAVSTAKRALVEAEDKLRLVKKLGAAFEKDVTARVKEVEKLRSLTGIHLLKGVRHLEALIDALARYTSVSVESSEPAPEPEMTEEKSE